MLSPLSNDSEYKGICVFKCFYDDALTGLVNLYANRTIIVSCTKDYT